MTKDLITAEDVQERLDDWLDEKQIPAWIFDKFRGFPEQLAGNLSATAEARADKRVAAGERLVETAKGLLTATDDWKVRKGLWNQPGTNSPTFKDLGIAIAAYEEAASDA